MNAKLCACLRLVASEALIECETIHGRMLFHVRLYMFPMHSMLLTSVKFVQSSIQVVPCRDISLPYFFKLCFLVNSVS